MPRWLWSPFARMRRGPLLLSAAALTLLAAAACVGLHVWALGHYRAAEQAVNDDCLWDADQHIRVCLMVWPRSATTYLLAARIARLNGDYALAETRLDECRRLQADASLDTCLETLFLRAEQGQIDELEPELAGAAGRDASHARLILEALGRSELNVMRYREAVRYLRLCMARFPDDVCAIDACGLALERAQRPDNAKRAYKEALELSHGRSDVRLRLANLYLEDSDPDDAEPLLAGLRQEQPDRVEVQSAWARCQFLRGRLDEARRSLDAVLARRPGDPTALLWRGQVALNAGDGKEAEGYVRRALEGDRSNPEAFFLLYRALRLQTGRDAEAQEALAEQGQVKADRQRLAEMLLGDSDQGSRSPEALADVGELCLRLGREQMGLFWFSEALKADPGCGRARKDLADYYAARGDLEASRRYQQDGR